MGGERAMFVDKKIARFALICEFATQTSFVAYTHHAGPVLGGAGPNAKSSVLLCEKQ
jgi:hypothetical protein